MKHNPITYLILALTFILSVGAAWLLPTEELLKSIIAAPGVLALLAAIWQIMRDQAAHEKSQEMQLNQFRFTLGASSHMANVAFDKHVAFCEQYVSELHNAATTLFREGPTEIAMNHANELLQLRRTYAVWLTDSMNINLAEFEKTLRNLGADVVFIRNTTDNALRAEAIKRSGDVLLGILAMDDNGQVNEDLSVENVKNKVRKMLGVEELTGLREHLVRESTKAVEKIT